MGSMAFSFFAEYGVSLSGSGNGYLPNGVSSVKVLEQTAAHIFRVKDHVQLVVKRVLAASSQSVGDLSSRPAPFFISWTYSGPAFSAAFRTGVMCKFSPRLLRIIAVARLRALSFNIWGETIYLSQVLTAISASVRNNPSLPKIYWLQVCRSGSLVNIECESGQVRELSGGSSTPDIPPPPPLPSLLRLRTLSANAPSSPLTLFYLKCLFVV